MQFITRELLGWPRPITEKRISCPYGVDYARILNLMEKELESLEVEGDVVIQIDASARSIRRDGLPNGNNAVRTPRVALAFISRAIPFTYYCDRFIQWQGNIRAIGLGLQRLRLVEETGIVSRGEQYMGFRALPPGIQLGARMTTEEAADVIVELSGSKNPSFKDAIVKKNSLMFKRLYRDAAKRTHHDTGGDRKDWDKLQDAAAVIEDFYKAAGVK